MLAVCADVAGTRGYQSRRFSTFVDTHVWSKFGWVTPWHVTEAALDGLWGSSVARSGQRLPRESVDPADSSSSSSRGDVQPTRSIDEVAATSEGGRCPSAAARLIRHDAPRRDAPSADSALSGSREPPMKSRGDQVDQTAVVGMGTRRIGSND